MSDDSHLPPPPGPGQPPPPPPMVPPGYVAYGSAGVMSRQASRIGGLTKWMVGLLIAQLVAAIALVAVQLGVVGSAKDFVDGIISESAFEDKLVPYLLTALLAAGVALAASILTIVWTFRISRNLEALGHPERKFTPGATVAVNLLGGCTLGIINFFMWRELWKGSDPAAVNNQNWKQGEVSPLPAVQLGLTIGGAVLSGIAGAINGVTMFRVGGKTSDIGEQLADHIGLIVISSLLSLAASAVFIVFARQLAARHMQATSEG